MTTQERLETIQELLSVFDNDNNYLIDAILLIKLRKLKKCLKEEVNFESYLLDIGVFKNG